MRKAAFIASLLALSACDYVEKADFNRERSDHVYQSAMEDYRAGRLAASVEGLEKVCAMNPANASARFQLACLLQDWRKDYLGAYCAYREYLAQAPTSDKARLARERLATCEREMSKTLASRYGLNAVEDDQRAALAVQEKLTRTEKRVLKLTRDLESAMQRMVSLEAENDRLKGYLRSSAQSESGDSNGGDVREAKELLAETESSPDPSSAPELTEAKALLTEVEEKPLLEQPVHAKEERAKREEGRAKREETSSLPSRPSTYVVQEGDSLYKIALKFYGRSSAWSQIREANKAVISTDGRVRAGQKIVLP